MILVLFHNKTDSADMATVSYKLRHSVPWTATLHNYGGNFGTSFIKFRNSAHYGAEPAGKS
jgi:hypothetical protein